MHSENFPNLDATNHKVTSAASWEYNCIAWTLGDDKTWWSSAPGGYYWPPRVPKPMAVVANVVKLYERLGFEVCESDTPEGGFEKVALYASGGRFQHAAAQLEDGRWKSKLGDHEDIEHDSLDALLGGEFEVVTVILRRKRKA